jgi:hypothetical protein
LGVEIFLHTREHRADSIDEAISLHSYLECDGTLQIVDLSEEWHEDLRREKVYHISSISIISHEEILIISLRASE